MALPDTVRRVSEQAVEQFCGRRIPAHLRDQIRLEFVTRGIAITITERRPPWKLDLGPEWTIHKVAQLRYDGNREEWTLWWPGRKNRWEQYRDINPARDVGPLLREIDEDPTARFWG